MKVENLQKATELKEKLRKIKVRIETVELATDVKMYGSDPFETCTSQMKYEKESLLKAIKPLFLSALEREKQDILNEIEALD